MPPIETLIKVLQEELDRVTEILENKSLAVNIEHRASLSMYRVQLAEKIYKHSQPKTTDSVSEMLTELGGPALDDLSSAGSIRG